MAADVAKLFYACAYFICFSASFTTSSTGAEGLSFSICTTTFCDGAGAKPSIVSAPTASSLTSLSTGAESEPPAGISSAMPSSCM